MPIRQERFSLPSLKDALILEGLLLIPDHPKAIVQIVHGMAEHLERYRPVMETLAEAGYIAVIHNHRGHGRCAMTGHFGTAGAEGLIADTLLVMNKGKARFPPLPFFLFGHSMGSLIARCVLRRCDRELDGLFLCGSPCMPQGAIRAGQALVALKLLLHADTRRDQLVNRLVTGAFNRGIPNASSPNQWISRNAENVTAYDQDPLCGFCFTLNGFQGLLALTREAYSKKGWALRNTRLPVHFLSGEEDHCRGGNRTFHGAVESLRRRGYPVSVTLYPNMRHEILNETDRATVYKDLIARLNEWSKQ